MDNHILKTTDTPRFKQITKEINRSCSIIYCHLTSVQSQVWTVVSQTYRRNKIKCQRSLVNYYMLAYWLAE